MSAIQRFARLIAIGCATAVPLLLTEPAWAETPNPNAAPLRDPGAEFDKLPARERIRVLEQQNREFEQRRVEALRERRSFTPSGTPAGRSTLVVTVERYVDGFILYSMPYEQKNEPAMLGVGFRRVDRAEDIGPMTLFNGRLYRAMMADVAADAIPRAVGREVTLTVEARSGAMQVAVDAVPKR